MLVTDDELEQAWTGRGVVTFCRRHIGIPLERAPGNGSTASPRRMKFWGCWHVFTVSSWKTAKALRLCRHRNLWRLRTTI
jgi:hypothetical protein